MGEITPDISVIIPTYNPKEAILGRTMEALIAQVSARFSFEVILIDNNSRNGVPEIFAGISYPFIFRVVREPRQGLTYARLKGFSEAKADIIVLVDDDNILAENYLLNALDYMQKNHQTGAAGGKSLPEYGCPPPAWLSSFAGNLAVRDLGNEVLSTRLHVPLKTTILKEYPAFAPIGAGMVVRKEALKKYLETIESKTDNITDRKGDSLTSGGDNDLVMHLLESGYEVAYLPQLSLLHLIPCERLTLEYHCRLAHDIAESWVRVLNSHNLRPWKPIAPYTLPFRKIKAWLIYQPWKNEINKLKWAAARGTLEGLSKI